MQHEKFLTLNEVLNKCSISKTTLERLIINGKFPKPIKAENNGRLLWENKKINQITSGLPNSKGLKNEEKKLQLKDIEKAMYWLKHTTYNKAISCYTTEQWIKAFACRYDAMKLIMKTKPELKKYQSDICDEVIDAIETNNILSDKFAPAISKFFHDSEIIKVINKDSSFDQTLTSLTININLNNSVELISEEFVKKLIDEKERCGIKNIKCISAADINKFKKYKLLQYIDLKIYAAYKNIKLTYKDYANLLSSDNLFYDTENVRKTIDKKFSEIMNKSWILAMNA